MKYNLRGKNVLVTGGAKGIGRAITTRCVQEGCCVWVADNDPQALAALDATWVTPILLDISDKKQVAHVISKFDHKIDILINNAAITCGDNFAQITAVNCNGTRYVTEAILPMMVERQSGNIIFITSVHTAMGFQGDAAYDASKHWAVGYMRARALELAPLGIRLNAIAPGAICRAGSGRDAPQGVLESVAAKIPLRRWGNPEDIADAVAFLMSDESSYITGHELRVDGGLSIKNPLQD